MAVGVTNFPATLDTLSTLVRAISEGSSTLNGFHLSTATSIVCVNAGSAPVDGIAVITDGTDYECVTYASRTGTTLNGVVRGVDTLARAWASGATIYFDAVPALKHNVLAAAMIATQAKLGATASTPAAGLVLQGTGAGTSEWKQPGLILLDANSFTTQTQVIVDNIFTSTYDEYLVEFVVTAASVSSAISHRMQMRAGGVTANGAATYAWTRYGAVVSNGVSTFSSGGDTSIVVALGSTSNGGKFFTKMDIASPALADHTFILAQAHSTSAGFAGTNGGGYHALSSAHDGFRYFPDSGTITGRYRVYGYGKTL